MQVNTYDRLVYDGWLQVYQRDINGKVYDIIKSSNAVCGIVLNVDSKILLVKQFRPTVEKYTWEIPAGCMDIPNETPEECLFREIQEETGFAIDKHSLEHVIDMNSSIGFNNGILSLYITHLDKDNVNTIHDDDVIEMKWFTLSDFQDMINNKEIIDMKTIFSYYYLVSRFLSNQI